MVIQKFNKLIRNKWVWGVFAVAISAAFCFDDLFADRGNLKDSESNPYGVKVDEVRLRAVSDDIRAFGRQRGMQIGEEKVVDMALETCAMLEVGERNGIIVSEGSLQAEIRNTPYFQTNGAFDFQRYVAVLQQLGLTPEHYEQRTARQMAEADFGRVLASSAVWSSPMEVKQAAADMTDRFTVRIARFEQSKQEADAVKLDQAALRKWFDANVKSLEVPERVRIRYVKFDATKPAVMSRMTVTDDELHDYYDSVVDRFVSTDTNGVEHVKAYEEVKGELERELRVEAAVEFYKTNLNYRVFASKAAPKSSRLDEIAKEEDLKVQTSDWFALDGAFVEGFMKRPEQILPGAQDLVEAVAELSMPDANAASAADADSGYSDDYRYAVVRSNNAVWLVEKAEISAKHLPTFAEAQTAILPRALREARADAFKASVEAIAKKGPAAVAATKGISTNITYCVSELVISPAPAFEDQLAVVRAAARLQKGEVSEFTLTAPGKALLVICEGREPGDPLEVIGADAQVRSQLATLQYRQLPEAWRQWNVNRFRAEPKVAEESAADTEAAK